jgi:hypothetical protein
MKEKMKALLKKILMVKEAQGEPLDLSPGLKVRKTVEVSGKYTFNEIAQNIINQQKLMR